MKAIHALKPVLVTAPTTSPVSLAEARAHLRVDHTDEDTIIQTYIDAATAHLDGWAGILGRCLVTQTWRQDLAEFPIGVLRLPFPDVQTVAVAYTDTNGADQTFTGFDLVDDYLGAGLVLADGQVWPATDDIQNAVRVTFVCGYGAAADVPSALKAAILLHVGTLYENRETLTDRLAPNMAYEALTAPYRRVGI